VKKFSLDELRDAWDEYTAKVVYRLLSGGKWTVVDKLPAQFDAVRIDRVKAKEAMDFPEYLERYHAG